MGKSGIIPKPDPGFDVAVILPGQGRDRTLAGVRDRGISHGLRSIDLEGEGTTVDKGLIGPCSNHPPEDRPSGCERRGGACGLESWSQ